MRDKRVFPRLQRKWVIEYKIFGNAKAESTVIISGIIDVGGGGFCLESDSPLPIETLIQFAIKPKDDPKPIIGVAKIVWSRVFNDSFKNGVNFVWANWKGVASNSLMADYVKYNLFGRPT
jgi:hypothetical protein